MRGVKWADTTVFGKSGLSQRTDGSWCLERSHKIRMLFCLSNGMHIYTRTVQKFHLVNLASEETDGRLLVLGEVKAYMHDIS